MRAMSASQTFPRRWVTIAGYSSIVIPPPALPTRNLFLTGLALEF